MGLLTRPVLAESVEVRTAFGRVWRRGVVLFGELDEGRVLRPQPFVRGPDFFQAGFRETHLRSYALPVPF